MGEVFIASDALRQGNISGYALRRWYRPIFPDVHVPKRGTPSLEDRTYGAWLWSKRGGVVTGIAASALHGAQWIDDDATVELIWNCTRPPVGIVTRNERLGDDEMTKVAGIPVTTPARTAFDLGRFQPRGHALARLDALMHATPFSVEEVLLLTKRYRGARGVRRLKDVLPLVDGGAASPRETWLRLLFVDAGLPSPTTQIPVVDEWGHLVRVLDMGWEEFKVAAEYDGDQHRTDRKQYVKDVRSLPKLERLGWIVIRVIKEDREDDIIARVWRAVVSRGWQP
jgi:hypothetical protein